MAKAIPSGPSDRQRDDRQLRQQLSPSELRCYIHFLRGSLHDNPGGKSVLRALMAEKKAERKRERG